MPNAGNFCVDGLVYPDRTPHTGFEEAKYVYQPFFAEYAGNGNVSIKNRNFFKGLDDVGINWEIKSNGKLIASGEVSGLMLMPREKKDFSIFDPSAYSFTGETYLTLHFVNRTDKLWAKPATCSASRLKKDLDMKSGKYAFCAPVSLNLVSSILCIFSQIAYPYGLITIHPLTGDCSASSALTTRSLYH